MKHLTTIAAALSLTFTATVAPLPAAAAPKRVKGEYCYFPVEPGTWVGFFDGGKRETAWNGRDVIRQVTFWRCFQTKANCVAWKYWVQTDYSGPAPQITWCRRK